jgi:hypothetical protein
MKNSRKMVLVDYEKYMQNQNPRHELNVKPKPLLNLDQQIYNILQRDDLSDYEKQKLYTSKLNKYLFFVNHKLSNTSSNESKKLVPKEEVQEKPKFVFKRKREHINDSENESNQEESAGDDDDDDDDTSTTTGETNDDMYKTPKSTPLKDFKKKTTNKKTPKPSTSNRSEKTLTPKNIFENKKGNTIKHLFNRRSPIKTRSKKKIKIDNWLDFKDIVDLSKLK